MHGLFGGILSCRPDSEGTGPQEPVTGVRGGAGGPAEGARHRERALLTSPLSPHLAATSADAASALQAPQTHRRRRHETLPSIHPRPTRRQGNIRQIGEGAVLTRPEKC